MKTKPIHRTMGAWLLPLFIILSIKYGTAIWFAVSILLYLWIAITVTAGYHRYYTHGMYDCSKFWQYAFGFTGCISLNSSPVEWATVHIIHHKTADTSEDPYDSTFRYFFRVRDRVGIKLGKRGVSLLRDSMQKFFVENSFTLSVVYGIIVTMVFGIVGFVFLYGLPTTLYLVTSGIHTIYAHKDKQPRNYWFMEFIIPMAGEWIHKEHHDNPRIVIFNHRPEFFDLGGLFIRGIRREERTKGT